MTTTNIVDQPQEPVDIDVAMARLILLRREHKLPAPTAYQADTKTRRPTLYVYMSSVDAMSRWADALGIELSRRRVNHYEDGSQIHTADIDRDGWAITLWLNLPKPAVVAALDAEMVAELEQVAGVSS